MKKFACMIMVLVTVMMVMMVAQGEEEVSTNGLWGLYTEKAVGEWHPLNPGEVIEAKELRRLMVVNLESNQRIHWRWIHGMDSWCELEKGDPFINIDGYRASYGWDVLELQVMDAEGIYHAVGKYPVKFSGTGDFYMNSEECMVVSWGDGTIGISMAYEYDIEVKIANVTLVTMANVPAGNILLSDLEIGDVIIITGKNAGAESLPVVYQVNAGDFALMTD